MPSKLGKLIQRNREEKNLGLREFAGHIGKSPSFVVKLEKDEEVPAVKEETLLRIADVLGLNPDIVMAAAAKLPGKLRPKSELELALYRQVKGMTNKDKLELRDQLTRRKEK